MHEDEAWRQHEFINMDLGDRRKMYGEFYQMIVEAGWPTSDWARLTYQIKKEMREDARNNGF